MTLNRMTVKRVDNLIKKICLFSLLILILDEKGYAQVSDTFSIVPDTLVAIKRRCTKGLAGSRIQILESKVDVLLYKKKLLTSPLQDGYSYSLLYNAPPEMKIKVLEELLSFEPDSSLSCTDVEPYWDIAKDSISVLESKKYSIQIDALIHFNFICFGQYAPKYSPFPVLYDNQAKREINNDFNKIRDVFSIYRRWFNECKLKGFKNYSFPLLNSKYEWRFGKKEKIVFRDFPIVRGDLLHRLGIPKSN